MRDAITERGVTNLRVHHLAGEDATEPEGGIVFHTLFSSGNEVLCAPDCRMSSVNEVWACPMPVQQSLFGIAAPWARWGGGGKGHNSSKSQKNKSTKNK